MEWLGGLGFEGKEEREADPDPETEREKTLVEGEKKRDEI